MIDELVNGLIALVPSGVSGLLILIVVILASLMILGKGADILVDEAVKLSERWGVPKMIIGATIVSLGTTLPEATVSVMGALKGSPGLAMGNAVGSIICDTGLILGIAALIRPLPFRRAVVNRQGWVQLGAGLLLVVVSFIFGKGSKAFSHGAVIPQFVGWIFLLLLATYLIRTVWAARKECISCDDLSTQKSDNSESTFLILVKMIVGIALVIFSSKILIPTVQETAFRFHIPENIIAATLVAFGTSLPELTTAIAASKKGHGDLAIGNVIGADILNVLFVVGAAASVTKGGLEVQQSFFYLLFPAMLFVLVTFKGAVIFSKSELKRPVGFVLLFAYICVTVLSYVTGI